LWVRERVAVKSPVLEYCTPGSVGGAPGNRRPYPDTLLPLVAALRNVLENVLRVIGISAAGHAGSVAGIKRNCQG